eukprot:TRINITY_DN2203_c0_g2_i1.p1 TRINITY_DN2203_c0_g2~~TRINITY_DN2203_c0_g2_i1.p1  ORF type:complete len:587 (-),score=116.20 TRINITY_DN2203_c0_g2_i1:153-1913(-)
MNTTGNWSRTNGSAGVLVDLLDAFVGASLRGEDELLGRWTDFRAHLSAAPVDFHGCYSIIAALNVPVARAFQLETQNTLEDEVPVLPPINQTAVPKTKRGKNLIRATSFNLSSAPFSLRRAHDFLQRECRITQVPLSYDNLLALELGGEENDPLTTFLRLSAFVYFKAALLEKRPSQSLGELDKILKQVSTPGFRAEEPIVQSLLNGLQTLRGALISGRETNGQGLFSLFIDLYLAEAHFREGVFTIFREQLAEHVSGLDRWAFQALLQAGNPNAVVGSSGYEALLVSVIAAVRGTEVSHGTHVEILVRSVVARVLGRTLEIHEASERDLLVISSFASNGATISPNPGRHDGKAIFASSGRGGTTVALVLRDEIDFLVDKLGGSEALNVTRTQTLESQNSLTRSRDNLNASSSPRNDNRRNSSLPPLRQNGAQHIPGSASSQNQGQAGAQACPSSRSTSPRMRHSSDIKKQVMGSQNSGGDINLERRLSGGQAVLRPPTQQPLVLPPSDAPRRRDPSSDLSSPTGLADRTRGLLTRMVQMTETANELAFPSLQPGSTTRGAFAKENVEPSLFLRDLSTFYAGRTAR